MQTSAKSLLIAKSPLKSGIAEKARAIFPSSILFSPQNRQPQAQIVLNIHIYNKSTFFSHLPRSHHLHQYTLYQAIRDSSSPTPFFHHGLQNPRPLITRFPPAITILLILPSSHLLENIPLLISPPARRHRNRFARPETSRRFQRRVSCSYISPPHLPRRNKTIPSSKTTILPCPLYTDFCLCSFFGREDLPADFSPHCWQDVWLPPRLHARGRGHLLLHFGGI